MSAFELEVTVCAGGKGHVTTTVAVATAEELESLAETMAAAIRSWQVEREHKGQTPYAFPRDRHRSAPIDWASASADEIYEIYKAAVTELASQPMDAGPMDADTLRALRLMVRVDAYPTLDTVAALLEDRDWHRARVDITWEDVARVDDKSEPESVLPIKTVAYMREHAPRVEKHLSHAADGVLWLLSGPNVWSAVYEAVYNIARELGRPGLDVLDEIADSDG